MSDSLLAVEGVCLSFGGLQALHDVSLTVDPGSIVGLIGPNGAGKTTTFNVISGLQQPDDGVVVLDGRDITSLPAHARAKLGMARSFQNLGLIEDESALVNVLAAGHLGAGYTGLDLLVRPWRRRKRERELEARAHAALARFGLLEAADTVVTDLSFAAARFVEIASLVARRPRLMLLDEPTTGLDVRETDVLAHALRRLRDDGTTFLVVAHDVRFVMGLCDQVYVLAEGAVLASGSPRVVQQDPAVVAAYLGRSA